MVAPDGHVGRVAPGNTGFLRELRFGAVLVEAHHGEPAFAGNGRCVAHGNEAIGVARIADHEDADIGSGVLFNRPALADKDLAVDAEQFLAFHTCFPRHTADEQGPGDSVEAAVEVAGCFDALKQRKGAVLQFHGHTLQGGHAGLDFDQLENDGLIGPEHLAAGYTGQEGIADLAGRAGYGDTNCFFHRGHSAANRGPDSTKKRRHKTEQPRSASRPNGVVRVGEVVQSLLFKSFPAPNFTPLEALILMRSPVFGFTPSRALRLTTLKVPKPTSCMSLFFLRCDLIPSITALTARSASAFVLPSSFWTDSTSLTLFIVG